MPASDRRAGRQEVKEMMRSADALLRAGKFEEVDDLLDVKAEYSVRQRLALLTATLFAGDKLKNRAAFYAVSAIEICDERGAKEAVSLLAGLKEPKS